ncbi:MAG TPA: ABATE domain-containing protein [Trebonia sp.]|jgi:predicted RNA-binding Zn ribbon-like protein|nr:ABATE domain-containing protein [Trebonia sp.]
MTATATDAGFRHGSGRISLDFIRTLRHRGTAAAVEELPDARALAAWITQFGPCPASAAAVAAGEGAAGQSEAGQHTAASAGAEQAVARARRLREAVFALIAAAREQSGAGPVTARETVNEMAALPAPTPQLDLAGAVRWETSDPVSATLALIARDAIDLVASPAITRVRDCANPECGAIFLDVSRPGSRRWCSMNTCGNQAKKTTLRNKRTVSTGFSATT